MRKSGFSNFLLYVLIVAVGVLIYSNRPWSPGTNSEEGVKKIVEKYIQDNPEKIIASLQNMQKKQAGVTSESAKKTIVASKEQLLNDKNSGFGGNPDGDVAIVEFFDYSCHYCKNVFPDLKKLLDEDKGVKLILKEFPILGPDSETAAKAAIAVFKLDPKKYFAYHAVLIQLPGQKSEEVVLDQAKKLGLSPSKVKEEMNKPEVAEIIAANRALAGSLGVRGTPGFIIGGELIPGALPYDQLKQKVDEARKTSGGEKPAEDKKGGGDKEKSEGETPPAE